MLEQFNLAEPDAAAAALRPCLAVSRWIDTIVDERPYPSLADLEYAARRAAAPFTQSELDSALSHHPRIGERASGSGAEATMSRSEQAQVGITDATAQALREGNRAYEGKFDRVFLIRAAGRSAEDILQVLTLRLQHSFEQENEVIESELREIAAIRIRSAMNPESEVH